MSRVGSTHDTRLKGRQATNRNTFETSPVAGSTSVIVGPAQSASMMRPALWPTRLVTCVRTVNSLYRLQKRS